MTICNYSKILCRSFANEWIMDIWFEKLRIRWTVFVYISKLFVVKKNFYSWNFGLGMNNLVFYISCRFLKPRLLSLAKNDVIVVMLWFLVSCTSLVIYDSCNLFLWKYHVSFIDPQFHWRYNFLVSLLKDGFGEVGLGLAQWCFG